jgi:hypothetical protein
MILRNDFHNSQVQINLRGQRHLSPSQAKRAHKQLCGMADCRCGGIRGPQSLKGKSVTLIPCQDGSIVLEEQ